MPTVNCIHCGAEFHRRPSDINPNGHNFCSHACYDAYRGKLLVNCTFCGAEFRRRPSAINPSGLNFCSLACRGAYQRTGSYINPDGYRMFSINGKLISEHRFVMEQHLGRELLSSEHVHHKDENPLNNSLSNLVVLSLPEHNREHHPLMWDLETAKALRAEGISFEKIGKALGVDGRNIWSAFVRRGLHIPGTLTWDLERAKALRAEGFSFDTIAKALGVTGEAIRQAFVERGLHTPKG
jgi:hypothetical protein